MDADELLDDELDWDMWETNQLEWDMWEQNQTYVWELEDTIDELKETIEKQQQLISFLRNKNAHLVHDIRLIKEERGIG